MTHAKMASVMVLRHAPFRSVKAMSWMILAGEMGNSLVSARVHSTVSADGPT